MAAGNGGGTPKLDVPPPPLDPASTPPAVAELRAIRIELHEGRTLTRQLLGVLMDLRDELHFVRLAGERSRRAEEILAKLDVSDAKTGTEDR